MSQIVAGIVLGGWVVEAFVLGYVMGRRGYEGFAWTVVGMALGPIAVVVALYYVRRPPSREPVVLHLGRHGRGHVDVLVGVDGSPESIAAIRHARALLGSRIGRLTIATVVAVDATPDNEHRARHLLQDAAAEAGGLDPNIVVLRGSPVVSLRHYAETLGYELIAVGTRGEGRTHALVGSVATGLSRGRGVPVLLVDADDVAADQAA